MNRKKYFDDPEGSSSYPQAAQFQRTWNKVLKFEESFGKTLDEGYTREEYIRLFSSLLVQKTGTFLNDRKVVLHYVRYMISHQVLPEEHEQIIFSIKPEELSIKPEDGRIRYYKNLSMLREMIQSTIDAAARADDMVFDVPVSILYLAWFGLTEEEIINLPKDAVTYEGVTLNGQMISMPSFVTEILTRLRDADGYYKQSKGLTFMRYAESPNLIRTLASSQMTVLHMRRSLSRMDKILDHIGALRFEVVRLSGIFYRAYMLECESTKFNLDDLAFASKVFCEDFVNPKAKTDVQRIYRQRMNDYTLYKRLFY